MVSGFHNDHLFLFFCCAWFYFCDEGGKKKLFYGTETPVPIVFHPSKCLNFLGIFGGVGVETNLHNAFTVTTASSFPRLQT